MKKLLLLFIATLFVSCSSDESDPINPDPIDGLSVTFELQDCTEINECYINYRLKNESEYEKHFFIKFTFAESDSHYDSDSFLRETLADPNETSIVQIHIDEGNTVETVEIVDVEIIE